MTCTTSCASQRIHAERLRTSPSRSTTQRKAGTHCKPFISSDVALCSDDSGMKIVWIIDAVPRHFAGSVAGGDVGVEWNQLTLATIELALWPHIAVAH